MAYSTINNGIKQEPNSHFHDLLHAQLSAEDPRNTDNQDSAEDSGESPLDFSIKRKSKGYEEVSGSDSLSSPASASSLNDTGGHSEDRKSSDNDNHGRISNRSMSLDSPRNSSPSYGDKHFSSNESINQQLSPIEERIGQPKTADHEHSSSKHGIPNMINDLQMGLANANMLANSFPAMAALMDPMRMAGSSKGSRRPFKAYPSDVMSMAERTSGIPQYLSSFATFENSAIMQGLNLTSEEIFSIYKQQLLALRERNKYLEVLKLSQEHSMPSRSSTSTISSAHTSIPSSLTSMHLSTLTPSISSMNLTNKNNSFNNNMIGSIPSSPIGSSSPIMNHSNVNKSSTPGLTPGGRRRPRSLPDDQKDESYWERRRKNNDAAKRSRDSRRAKEDEIAIRAALLEQENLKLRVEVAALKTETAKLRCMLYNS